jgi:hypothetical protein
MEVVTTTVSAPALAPEAMLPAVSEHATGLVVPTHVQGPLLLTKVAPVGKGRETVTPLAVEGPAELETLRV